MQQWTHAFTAGSHLAHIGTYINIIVLSLARVYAVTFATGWQSLLHIAYLTDISENCSTEPLHDTGRSRRSHEDMHGSLRAAMCRGDAPAPGWPPDDRSSQSNSPAAASPAVRLQTDSLLRSGTGGAC